MHAITPILLFDVLGPLAVYYLLRSAGLSTVPSLLLSGVFPAVGIALSVVSKRRLDAIGTLVLAGILIGSVLGLASGSANLVLLDGTVPTAAFGVVCLVSLWSERPMIFRIALETMGPDTRKGRDLSDRWRDLGFRHAFRIITAVWGIAFLAEAIAQLIIIETVSTDDAKVTANTMPLLFAGAVVVWTLYYSKRSQRRGENAARKARARGETPPAMPT